MTQQKPIQYLEDLTIGQIFSCGSIQLSEQEIIDYATSYDSQPFHVDKEAAKKSVFQGLAASGWHTASLTNKLVIENGLNIANGYLGMGLEISWQLPVRINDTLHVQVEIVDIVESKSKQDRGIVSLKIQTKNQNGEQVQEIRSKILVIKRPQD